MNNSVILYSAEAHSPNPYRPLSAFAGRSVSENLFCNIPDHERWPSLQ